MQRNPIMDQKSYFIVKLIIYLGFCFSIAFLGAYFGFVDHFLSVLAAWLGGLFFWTLAEYLIHRFLFHTWGSVRKRKLVPILLADHGRHHRFAEEMATDFRNLLLGLPVLLIFGVLCYPILGGYAFPFLSGFSAGYGIYMLVHYAIHRSSPPFAWIAPLWRHHYLHHFHQPNKCFGVTTIFWDRLFGTWESRKKLSFNKKVPWPDNDHRD